MKKVNFGVIGSGNVANNYYLPYISKVANLVVVCDKILERAKRSANLWNAKRYCSDPEKVFSAHDVDVVVILTPHNSHAELAVRAAESGKHFILQKPMATNTKDLKGIISAVEKYDVKALIEPSEPFASPIMREIKRLLENGEIGDPCLYMTYIGHSGPIWSDWFFKVEKGGGVIYDLAVYGVADSLYLFGEPYKVNASASIVLRQRCVLRSEEHTMTIAPEYYKKGRPMYYYGMKPSVPVNVTAFDNAVLTLTYDNGLLCTIFANYVTFIRQEMPSIQLYGSKGNVIVINKYRREIKLVKKEEEKSIKVGILRPYYEWSIDHIIECILKDLDPLPSVEWGRKITEILIRANNMSC